MPNEEPNRTTTAMLPPGGIPWWQPWCEHDHRQQVCRHCGEAACPVCGDHRCPAYAQPEPEAP